MEIKNKDKHPKINFGKTGILIINLGTPDSTSWLDIRKYLKEFLSDKRVIEVNPIIWQIILNLFILTFRPSKTAHAYKQIWIKETNESPLRFYTKKQCEKLNERISNEEIIIDYAMRYGNPSIKKKLKTLKSKGCENIIVLPLFHTGGLNCYANPVLHQGGQLVIMREFDPSGALEAIDDPNLSITHLFAVPAPLQFMMQNPKFDKINFSRLENVGVGGAPCAEIIIKKWQEKGIDVIQGWGMTETSPAGIFLAAEDSARKIGSAGKPVLHTSQAVSPGPIL